MSLSPSLKHLDMIHKEYNAELAWNLATRLGLVVGGFWIVSFLIVVLNFPSLLCDIGYLVGLMSVFHVGKAIRLVSSNVMPMRWMQRLSLALLSFMGGVLFTTLAQFVYFAYFDKGRFFDGMLEGLTEPSFVQMMKEAGNEAMLGQMSDMIYAMLEMSPRLIAFNFFTTNVIVAFIFALVASLFRGGTERK